MFLIDDLRKLATDTGHAVDGEVHKFLNFVEEKLAAVTPHVSFGRPDPVQPTAAPAQVVVTRPSIVEQMAAVADQPAPAVAEIQQTEPSTPATTETTPSENSTGS